MKGGTKKLAALIIAGGRSTRFWPEGRALRPKPLFKIDGKQSLIALTIGRLRPLIHAARTFVLVTAEQAAAFRPAIKGLLPERNLIVEPQGRGTTVAVAFGAAMIAQIMGEDTIVAVMPADHYIPQARQFRLTIAEAAGIAAAAEAVVVVGITPTRAETGYGYQEIGEPVGAGFKVTRFVEKPNLATARRMVRSSRFLWNGGMFVMTVRTLIRELRANAPELARAMDHFATMKPAKLRTAYAALKYDSFDRVVAEKSHNLISVRARFDWVDVGSWEGLWEALRDGSNSAVSGNVVAIDSDRVLARGGRRLMVLLGVNDLVAVDTDDAILIAPRSRSQELGRALDELARRGLHRYL